MTEYELADVISSYAVQGGTFFTIWLTILSAYAVVAYVVGKNLTTYQISWLNTLYLFATFSAIYGFSGSFYTQVFYIELIKEINPDSPQRMRNEMTFVTTALATFGTFATLKFMWDIRHPKAE